MKRIPKGYQGTELTTRTIGDLLPQWVVRLRKAGECSSKDLFTEWGNVAGDKVAAFSEAVAFVDGVLTVKVRSSVLYSVLRQNEGARLLELLQKKFPAVQKITFRRG